MDLISCESFGVSSYVSSLTSPGRASLSSGVYYYSVPTSPTGGHKYVPSNLESEPGDKLKITSTWISSSDSDGFEFTTTCRFENPSPNQQQQQQQQKKKKKKKKKEENCGEDPSAMMAFADELFCNGQVLPLKLPPRLQQVEKGKCNNRSSSCSSPRSPSSLLRWPILCCNLRSEEFDPFVAALENVMKEERGREAVTSTEKCIKSLSPQSTTPQLNHGSIPIEPTEVARLVSESLVGYSRSGHDGCIKPNFTKFPAPEENTCESLAQFTTVNGGSCHRGSAKHRIKNSIFRSSFEGWESKNEKLRDQNKVLRKFHYLKRFSFKSFYATLQCKDCI